MSTIPSHGSQRHDDLVSRKKKMRDRAAAQIQSLYLATNAVMKYTVIRHIAARAEACL